jgi:SOS-response transcriptional repressor LexA
MTGRILGYREHQVLALVTSDLKATGRVRSYDKIAAALGMRHKSHVCDTIGRLERRGLIRRGNEGVCLP